MKMKKKLKDISSKQSLNSSQLSASIAATDSLFISRKSSHRWWNILTQNVISQKISTWLDASQKSWNILLPSWFSLVRPWSLPLLINSNTVMKKWTEISLSVLEISSKKDLCISKKLSQLSWIFWSKSLRPPLKHLQRTMQQLLSAELWWLSLNNSLLKLLLSRFFLLHLSREMRQKKKLLLELFCSLLKNTHKFLLLKSLLLWLCWLTLLLTSRSTTLKTSSREKLSCFLRI